MKRSDLKVMFCVLLQNTEHSLFFAVKESIIRNKSPPSIDKIKKVNWR